MLRARSLNVKFIAIILIVIGMTMAAGAIAMWSLRETMLRNTARAVAEQVIAFRSWVAGAGVVWVDALQPDMADYLGQTGTGGRTFYSKNPALATRELSQIVARTGSHASFRVTSDNYRNAKNSPDAFESAAIHAFKLDLLRPESERKDFQEVYEGSTYRFAIPVMVAKPCLRCHGSPKDAPREVVDKYGVGRGFGYREGDIRGIITVSLPAPPLLSLSPAATIALLALISAVLLVSFILFRRLIMNRIGRMTMLAQKMAVGNLDMDLSREYRRNTDDEIDRLYEGMDTVRMSAKNALDALKKH
ncbi:MAG: DUF3365 domain-containing protein [Nitrospirota bacterium]|nr:DUF3365 domain-containing protein [Nitrospirota bacterium]